jgi:hypothetical protein
VRARGWMVAVALGAALAVGRPAPVAAQSQTQWALAILTLLVSPGVLWLYNQAVDLYAGRSCPFLPGAGPYDFAGYTSTIAGERVPVTHTGQTCLDCTISLNYSNALGGDGPTACEPSNHNVWTYIGGFPYWCPRPGVQYNLPLAPCAQNAFACNQASFLGIYYGHCQGQTVDGRNLSFTR